MTREIAARHNPNSSFSPHANLVQVPAIRAIRPRSYLTIGRCVRVLHKPIVRARQVESGRENK